MKEYVVLPGDRGGRPGTRRMADASGGVRGVAAAEGEGPGVAAALIRAA